MVFRLCAQHVFAARDNMPVTLVPLTCGTAALTRALSALDLVQGLGLGLGLGLLSIRLAEAV